MPKPRVKGTDQTSPTDEGRPDLQANLSTRTSHEAMAELDQIKGVLRARGVKFGGRWAHKECVVGALLLAAGKWAEDDPDALAAWLMPHIVELGAQARTEVVTPDLPAGPPPAGALRSPAASRPPLRRGPTAEEFRQSYGMTGPGPDDETVARWIDEMHSRKLKP